MRNFVSSVFMALALSLGLTAQETNPNAPEITFENDVIDFGTIEFGSDGTREFVFTNTGREPLIITSARGSCGCTVPAPPREPIAPGQKGTIKVTYDTKRTGPFVKTVTVDSNARTSKKVITIKGNVKPAEAQTSTTPVKPQTQSAVMNR
jgi:hypothetical protein